MLTKRLNQPFEVCSIDDPAFHKMDDKQLKKYAETRDISVLKIEELEEKPTIFLVNPLKQEFEHLPAQFNIMPQETCWRILKNHLIGASGFHDEHGGEVLKFEAGSNDSKVLSDECRKDIPMKIVSEIALVISEKATNGDYSPFSIPRTFSVNRARLKAHLAVLAQIEHAKK